MPWSAVPKNHKRIYKRFLDMFQWDTQTAPWRLASCSKSVPVLGCYTSHHKLRRSECASSFDADAAGPRLTQKQVVSDKKKSCFSCWNEAIGFGQKWTHNLEQRISVTWVCRSLNTSVPFSNIYPIIVTIWNLKCPVVFQFFLPRR